MKHHERIDISPNLCLLTLPPLMSSIFTFRRLLIGNYFLRRSLSKPITFFLPFKAGGFDADPSSNKLRLFGE